MLTCARSSKAAIAGCASNDAAIGSPDAVRKALVVAPPVEGPPASCHNHSITICAPTNQSHIASGQRQMLELAAWLSKGSLI